MEKTINFPSELVKQDRWCVWKYEVRNGKRTKIPFNAKNGNRAKSNDESTWSDFETARKVLETGKVDGLGYFFKPPFIGIDLDDVEDDVIRFKNGDHSDNIISEFYEAFKSYSEVSPSGTGIHMIVKGEIPGERRRKGDVEIYTNGRFFTMTGQTLGKYDEVTEAPKKNFKRIYEKYLDQEVKSQTFKTHPRTMISPHDLTESEIISKILESKNGRFFQELMTGNWEGYYTSQSEADLGLCSILAFWTANDFHQMDTIFRQSGLYREKWDEKRGESSTYGEQTIYKAINGTQNVYQPSTKEEPLKYVFGEAFGTSKDEKTKEYPSRSWDDTGNAERFLDRFGDSYKYSYINKCFYVYDGVKWDEDNSGMIRSLIDEMINDMKNEKVYINSDADDKEKKDILEAWQKHKKRSRSTAAKKNIVDELKHRRTIETDGFDYDPLLFNTINGYIDLSNGQLFPHDKSKMFSMQSYIEYTDTASPDVWIEFLDEIFEGDQEVIDYVQKALGYTLTASIKEQVMFILHGKGRNGKSVFVETVSKILGDYSTNIQADTIMVQKNKGVNSDIARLQNSRMVTSSEPNEGFRFDEGLIKQLTGGDRVTARFLYGKEFEFNPKFKLWVSTNHKPIIRGTDDGIWRRLVLIPFNLQIPKEQIDKELPNKLMRESSAILNWMVEGAYKWMQEGLIVPEKIANASKGYRHEMDVIEQFLEEEYEVTEDPEDVVKANDIYLEYKDWAKDAEAFLMNKNTFGMKMSEKFKRVRRKYGNVYLGLKPKQAYSFKNV